MDALPRPWIISGLPGSRGELLRIEAGEVGSAVRHSEGSSEPHTGKEVGRCEIAAGTA